MENSVDIVKNCMNIIERCMNIMNIMNIIEICIELCVNVWIYYCFCCFIAVLLWKLFLFLLIFKNNKTTENYGTEKSFTEYAEMTNKYPHFFLH